MYVPVHIYTRTLPSYESSKNTHIYLPMYTYTHTYENIHTKMYIYVFTVL